MSLSCLLDQHSEQLKQANRVFVGYSGGLDSTVLLHSAVQLLGRDKICVLHANHQLQPESIEWQVHCRHQAEKLGVEYRDVQLLVSNQGQGVENEARDQRYQFFREHLKAEDILLLGHHADDQAETLLYRLFRGAGVRGLSAIPEQRSEGQAILLRPLLNTSRQDLRISAIDAELEWVEDPSNEDTNYDRNYIRAEVLPSIVERWPAAKTTLVRASANLASTAALLDEYGDDLLLRCDWREARWGWSFEVKAFDSLSSAAQALLLSSAFREAGLNGFDSSCSGKVLNLLTSAEDKSPLLRAADSEMRRFASRLYLMPQIRPLEASHLEIIWNGRDALDIPACGLLRAGGKDFYEGGELKVTLRIGGERCKPAERERSQSLKKLMQEYSLEPWLRDRVPLVWQDGEILAVPSLFSCAADFDTPAFDWDLS